MTAEERIAALAAEERQSERRSEVRLSDMVVHPSQYGSYFLIRLSPRRSGGRSGRRRMRAISNQQSAISHQGRQGFPPPPRGGAGEVRSSGFVR